MRRPRFQLQFFTNVAKLRDAWHWILRRLMVSFSLAELRTECRDEGHSRTSLG